MIKEFERTIEYGNLAIVGIILLVAGLIFDIEVWIIIGAFDVARICVLLIMDNLKEAIKDLREKQ